MRKIAGGLAALALLLAGCGSGTESDATGQACAAFTAKYDAFLKVISAHDAEHYKAANDDLTAALEAGASTAQDSQIKARFASAAESHAKPGEDHMVEANLLMGHLKSECTAYASR